MTVLISMISWKPDVKKALCPSAFCTSCVTSTPAPLSSRPTFPFAFLSPMDLEKPLLLPLTSLSRYNCRWVLAFQAMPLHPWAVSLYSSEVTAPASTFCMLCLLELCQQLLVHPCRLLAFLPAHWDSLLWSWKEVIFEYQSAFLDPSSLQSVYPMGLFQADPWRGRPKSAHLKFGAVIWLFALLPLRILSQGYLWPSHPQQALPWVWVQGPAEHLSSLGFLSFGSGSCHWCTLGSSWTVYALQYCSSNCCQDGPWGQGLGMWACF